MFLEIKLRNYEKAEKQKREELKKREEDYLLKQEEIFSRLKSVDQKHTEENMKKLSILEEKLKKSEELKLRNIK